MPEQPKDEPKTEAKPKDIALMNAAELAAHIEARDKAHREEMNAMRALHRCRVAQEANK
jgi:hypothetical protein